MVANHTPSRPLFAKKPLRTKIELIVDFSRQMIHDTPALLRLAYVPELIETGSTGQLEQASLECIKGGYMMARYDALYKSLFESARLVEDLLREAFAVHPEFIDIIDFTSMRKLPGEVITEALHRRFIDSIWEIELTGRRGSVIVMLEFQSTIDPDMGLRVLAYSSVFLQSLIGQKRFPSAPERSYPTVVPLVLYNGKARWSAALDVRHRFVVMEDVLSRYQPSQYYVLVEEKQWVGQLPERCALFRALARVYRVRGHFKAG